MMFFFLPIYLPPLLNFHVSLLRARGRIDGCCDDKMMIRHRKLPLEGAASWLWNRLKREEHLSGLGCDEWFNKSDITTSAVARSITLFHIYPSTNPFSRQHLGRWMNNDNLCENKKQENKHDKRPTKGEECKTNGMEINRASEWSDDVMELFPSFCCERIFSRLRSSVLCLSEGEADIKWKPFVTRELASTD